MKSKYNLDRIGPDYWIVKRYDIDSALSYICLSKEEKELKIFLDTLNIVSQKGIFSNDELQEALDIAVTYSPNINIERSLLDERINKFTSTKKLQLSKKK